MDGCLDARREPAPTSWANAAYTVATRMGVEGCDFDSALCDFILAGARPLPMACHAAGGWYVV